MSAASPANALSTCAAARSSRWSKLPRSVLPSSATTRRPGVAGASSRRPAWGGGARGAARGGGGSQRGRVERVKEGAQRVDGGGAAEAGAEGGVEPLAMHADEQAGAAVGGGAGQHRQDAEQQQGGEAVAPALAAARVGDLLHGGEQAGERYHDSFRGEGFDPQQLRHPAGPSAARPALTNRSWPEPNSPAKRFPHSRCRIQGIAVL